MLFESAVLFESLEEIYGRVFRDLRPLLNPPGISVRFYRFTGLTSNIRLANGALMVKISDLLEQAPSPIQESLAYILLSKLFRQAPPKQMMERYRIYVARHDVRGSLNAARQQRGRKLLCDPGGACFDLVALFEDLNLRYFAASLPKPMLGWSRQRSRSILGHYDHSHHAIAVSRLLDHPRVPRYVVEYVLFHEMLHIKHPVEHRGPIRRIHTRAFKQEEKSFPQFLEAKAFLRNLR